jgi:beta-fructofuranosidase
MLLCISHNKGCRYYLGEWKDEKFTPDFHARMNWRATDFFAPESLLAADGRRIMWAWCNLGKPQTAIQSLPRELSLPDDGVLRIKPIRELETLREGKKQEQNIELKPDVPYTLKEIMGDALELTITFRSNAATEYGLQVYSGSNGKDGLEIAVNPAARVLSLGTIRAPFELKPGEESRLRVFLDKNMVEVFANDRQAMIFSHPYDAEHLRITLFAKGGDATVAEVTAWKMKSIYP